MVKKTLSVLLLFGVLIHGLRAQNPKDRWVDSVFSQLNTEQKIGQLFMITVATDQSTSDFNALENKIQSNALGGILFTKGKTLKQAELTNRFEAVSPVPLLIAVDGWNGMGTAMDSVVSFPP